MCGVAADRLRDGKAKLDVDFRRLSGTYLDSELVAVDIFH